MIKKLKDLFTLLNTSIFEGEKYNQNLKNLAIMALFFIPISIWGAVLGFYTNTPVFGFACIIYALFNALDFYFAVVVKDRKKVLMIAIPSELLFCTFLIVININGFSALWTILLPIAISYLCSVKTGILTSAYVNLLFMFAFWTPYRANYTGLYTEIFLDRFPVLYLFFSITTSYIMIEYHKSMLYQQQYAKELQAAVVAAKQANSAKSDFLASMSHEIRTPVNAVLGMNTLVLRESRQLKKTVYTNPIAINPGGANTTIGKSDDTATTSANVIDTTAPANISSITNSLDQIITWAVDIDSAGNNLLSIINDILDFSKIEARKIELVPTEYLLSNLLNDICNMISLRASDKGLNFEVDIAANLPDGLFGDEIRIRQILINLLGNAVKYTERGSIYFSVKKDDTASSSETNQRDISVSSSETVQHGDSASASSSETVQHGGSASASASETVQLVIAVSDTGIGIHPEDLGSIFSKFERVDKERNSAVEGTGLGLAITQNLIYMMGGDISVSSEYGKGSTFTVCLPQKVTNNNPIGDFHEKTKDMALRADEYHALFRAPSAKILIVDDTQLNLTVARGLLKKTDISIDTAESGFEALELCKENAYDLILLDQRMPKMDGIETLHKLKALSDNANHDVPVICLTADAVSGARKHYIEEGFTDYLSKPIDSGELEKMLLKYIPEDKHVYGDASASDASGFDASASGASASGTSGFGASASGAISGDTYSSPSVDGILENSSENFDEIGTDNDGVFLEFDEIGTDNDDVFLEFDAIGDSEDEYDGTKDNFISYLENAGFNTKTGLYYCMNDSELYLSVLEDFIDDAPNKVANLTAFYENNDMTNYTISVHSLKSTTKTLGAENLSAMAKMLEDAADNNDEKTVKDNHAVMMQNFSELVETIEQAIKNDVV